MDKHILDIIMMIANVMFGYSLIPTVIGSFKTKSVGIAWQTLILTPTGMFMFLLCYVSLGYWFAFTTGFIATTCWTILLCFKLKWRS